MSDRDSHNPAEFNKSVNKVTLYLLPEISGKSFSNIMRILKNTVTNKILKI